MVVQPTNAEFAALSQNFPDFEGTRSIIVIEATRISESCGYAVPLFGPANTPPKMSISRLPVRLVYDTT